MAYKKWCSVRLGMWGVSLYTKISSYQYRNPQVKIRRSRDRIIFNMEIPIPGYDGLYIEMGPWTTVSFISPDIYHSENA